MSQTTVRNQLHEKALYAVGEYLKHEAKLIDILQEIDRHKTYLHFEKPSLFTYATQVLKLGESIALALIAIARKSVQVPELKKALEEKKITISNARRIVPVLTAENQDEWISKAAKLSQVKLDQELAHVVGADVACAISIKLYSGC